MFTVAWWYLFFTWLGLLYGLFVGPLGFIAAAALCAVQILHFGLEDKNFFSLTCQIRAVMLVLCAAGLYEPTRWIPWIPVAGLAVRLSINYCLMARLMSLLPWNRKQPFSWELFRRTVFSPPTKGRIPT